MAPLSFAHRAACAPLIRWVKAALGLFLFCAGILAVSGAQLTLSWKDNSNNETGFKIERSLDGTAFSQIATVGANTVSYTNTGLADATRYFYRVRAYNAAGNSGYTNVSNAVTAAPPPPPPPPANTAPTITSIANQTINEDGTTGPIAFKVTDLETANGSLALSAASSNTTLVPLSRIIFGGVSTDRTVQINPAGNKSGTAIITVTVSDGQLTASRSFQVTVNPVNDKPTIGTIADQTISQDESTGPISFTIGDSDNATSTLSLSGTSSNLTLVPVSGIVFGGSGGGRTVTVTPAPAQSGFADITIQVSDGLLTATRTFRVTVEAVAPPPPPPPTNTAPTITSIANQTINEDTTTGPIAFKVADGETANGSLTLSASSSNTTLVPVSGIVFGGSDTDRTVLVNPAGNRSGAATITVVVSDGLLTASRAFQVTVSAVNDAPTVSNITNKTIIQDSSTGPIAFTVGDPDTALSSLVLTADSTNRTLVPLSAIVFAGSGQSRTVSVTPASGQSGDATITVRVSDGSLEVVDTFRLTVTPLDAVTVSLTAPSNGAVFEVGSPVNMTALVNDPARTARVEFHAGAIKLGQDTSSPYSYSWSGATAGSHAITAWAVETSGAVRESAAVTISVTEVVHLSVSMSSPSDDESIVLGESMNLEAVVTGPTEAIKRVDFYVGSNRIKQELYAPYTATWMPADPGTYALTARVISTTNTTTISAVRTVTVAPPPVTVNLVVPKDQASYPFGEAIGVEALVSDIAETVRVDFFDGSSKIKSEYYSPYAFSWTPAAAGTHTISAKVFDAAGNTRNSAPVEITVESPPDVRVVLESPSAGLSFLVGETVTLRASVSGGSAVPARVEFYRGSTRLGEDSSAPYAWSWKASGVGPASLMARAVSPAGEGVDSPTISVSVVEPPVTVSLTSPSEGQVYQFGETVHLAASVSDESRTERVEFLADDVKVGDDSSAPFVWDWTPSASGSRDVIARVVEVGGAIRDSTARVITVDDATPLKVTMSTPVDGAVIRIGESVTVSAVVDVSTENVERVEFFAGSTRIKTEYFTPYEFSWTPSATGTYTIRARGRNLAGTRYDSDRVTLVVKNLPVVAEIASPGSGSVMAFGQSVTVEASVSEPARTARVEFLVDGAVVSEDFEAPFAFVWENPGAGDHLIRVQAVDLDGDAVLSDPVSISVEDPPLTVSLTSPTNGIHVFEGGILIVEAVTSDVDRTSRLEFYVDDSLIGEDTEAPFGVDWVGAGLGSHTVHVKAHDLKGNASLSKSAIVNVDAPSGATPGVYRGSFIDPADGLVVGRFAAFVAADGAIAFLGHVESDGAAFFSEALTTGEDGEFQVVGSGSSGPVVLTARIGSEIIEGEVLDPALRLSGSRVSDSADSSFYSLVGVGNVDTRVYLVLGPDDQVFLGVLQDGHFAGRELVAEPSVSGAYISSEDPVLEITVDSDSGSARGFMKTSGGGFWVSGLRSDIPVAQRLENLSTRGYINPGNSVMIVGFVTDGAGTKEVLIRGVGPGLESFGASTPVEDPVLLLKSNGELIADNQRWFDEVNGPGIEETARKVGAFPLVRGSADAALLHQVGPGVYSAVIRDGLQLGGEILVEIYDADEGFPLLSELRSLATRGPVGAGKNLIGGFVISGNSPKRVLVRGIGPGLSRFGVADALNSTRLLLIHEVDGEDVTIGDNSGWSSDPQAGLIAEVAATVGAFALDPDSSDSALLLWLEPGAYTFIVQPGTAGQTGTALVEVYQTE
ncbi:MAG: Ig-like domain-containing protein [Opitutaceae bacterium]